MTKLQIINLIEETIRKEKEIYDIRLNKHGEDHTSTYMAFGSYYALKWLLDDIKEEEAKEVLNNGNNI
jgi:hypothetical protein